MEQKKKEEDDKRKQIEEEKYREFQNQQRINLDDKLSIILVY